MVGSYIGFIQAEIKMDMQQKMLSEENTKQDQLRDGLVNAVQSFS